MSTAAHFTGWVNKLAQEHTHALIKVAQREGLNAFDALDAAQEAFHTFLQLPQARSLVEHDEDAQKLLAVIVRNAARNMRRRHFRAAEHVPVDPEQLNAPAPSVDELMIEAEQHVQLLGCITRLNEVQRQVVTLRLLQEVQLPQVAQTLDLEPNHIAVLLYRAKQALQRCITQDLPNAA